MRKQILSIMCLAACLSVSGQEQLRQSCNTLRGDDALEKRQVKMTGFSLQVKDGVWSLEKAKTSKKSFVTRYLTETDTVMRLERGERTYYNQADGEIKIIGSENVQTLVSYELPEKWLRFPMCQGDSISGYFSGTGRYCDKLFLRRYGTYLTKADATGSLVLPEGDTLRHVLRIHTERLVGTELTPIDTLRYRIPGLTVDSIVRRMAGDTTLVREDVYRWYAEGYRYPVLEATVVSIGKEILSEEAFYCPPAEQERLVLDEANKDVRIRALEEVPGRDVTIKGNPFQYKISYRHDGVTVSYRLDSPTKIEALLASNQGYVYQRQEKNGDAGSGTIDISTAGLPRGQYVVYLNVNGKSHAEKINVR
jgi:hypothetical protein